VIKPLKSALPNGGGTKGASSGAAQDMLENQQGWCTHSFEGCSPIATVPTTVRSGARNRLSHCNIDLIPGLVRPRSRCGQTLNVKVSTTIWRFATFDLPPSNPADWVVPVFTANRIIPTRLFHLVSLPLSGSHEVSPRCHLPNDGSSSTPSAISTVVAASRKYIPLSLTNEHSVNNAGMLGYVGVLKFRYRNQGRFYAIRHHFVGIVGASAHLQTSLSTHSEPNKHPFQTASKTLLCAFGYPVVFNDNGGNS